MSKYLRRGTSSPINNERGIRRIEVDLNKVDELQAALEAIVPITTVVLGGGILALSNTVSSDAVIAEDANALSVGPVAIAKGKTVTIEDGGVWKII